MSTPPYPAQFYPGCPCYACDSPTWTAPADGWPVFAQRMSLCPTCGNKRCPGAADHNNKCSGSNEPGQGGSLYPHVATAVAAAANLAKLRAELGQDGASA